MDIYKTSDEIIKFYSSLYSSGQDRVILDETKIQDVFQNRYEQQFMQTNFNEPLFNGYSISESCNPVFNFIFFLIFDKYDYNEKKWIVQQINTLLKGLIRANIDYFKKNICISFEENPRVKVDDFDCNFIMKISTGDVYNSENSPYYVDDVLLEELKKVLKRCLSFWKIDDYENPGYTVAIGDTDYTYEIMGKNYNTICFSPFIVPPNQIQLFPIDKYIGNMIFSMFSDYNTLMMVMQEKNPSNVNEQLSALFSQIETIKQYTEMVVNHIDANLSPDVIISINKFIVCSYVFIILQSCKIFPKNKKYPETYDEIFTMFSNINTIMINDNRYLTNISSIRNKFFLPVNTEDVVEYSEGSRGKLYQEVDSRDESALQSAEEQIQPKEASSAAIVNRPSEEALSHYIDILLSRIEEQKKELSPHGITYANNEVSKIQSSGASGEEKHARLAKLFNILKNYIPLPPSRNISSVSQIPQNVDNLPSGWIKIDKNGVPGYYNEELRLFQVERPTFGGSRSTKKTSIKKRIIKKPKKTIRNTK